MVTQVEIFQWISDNLFVVGLGVFFILTWFNIWIGRIFAKLGKKVASNIRKKKDGDNLQEKNKFPNSHKVKKSKNTSFDKTADSTLVVSPVEIIEEEQEDEKIIEEEEEANEQDEEGYLDLTK